MKHKSIYSYIDFIIVLLVGLLLSAAFAFVPSDEALQVTPGQSLALPLGAKPARLGWLRERRGDKALRLASKFNK